MLPYIAQPTLSIGPLTIHAFGVLVATAVLVGAAVLKRRSIARGLDPDVSSRLVTTVLLCGFFGAHLVDRLVYFPEETLANPLSLFVFWEGLSSFGGFLGGVLGALFFVHRAKLGARSFRYIDAVAYAFPFGWLFGRLGCFLAFDHPGRVTSFFLGERYTDGLVRHNLGLYEALAMIPLMALFYMLGKKPRPAGFFTGLLALLYAPIRFGLDFLRIVDTRYFGLTPGQYGSILLFFVGLYLLLRRTPWLSAPLSRDESGAELA